MPASVQIASGQLTIDRSFTVSVEGSKDDMVERAVDRFKDQLNRRTAILLQKPVDPGHTTLTVHADRGSQKVQKVGDDESYDLTVTASGAKLTAPNPSEFCTGLRRFCSDHRDADWLFCPGNHDSRPTSLRLARHAHRRGPAFYSHRCAEAQH